MSSTKSVARMFPNKLTGRQLATAIIWGGITIKLARTMGINPAIPTNAMPFQLKSQCKVVPNAHKSPKIRNSPRSTNIGNKILNNTER